MGKAGGGLAEGVKSEVQKEGLNRESRVEE